MNLVLSGPIDDNLRNEVAALADPRAIVRLHEKAYRYERAGDSSEMRTRIAALCDAARVDHAYVDEGKRFSDFKLLAMDMDSTLITIECIDEIADFAGKKKEVAAITEAAMRGEIPDFAESLRRRVALLAGTSVDALRLVQEKRLHVTPGAPALLSAARAAGVATAIISGGFSYFADRLKRRLGIDHAYANDLQISDGRLTGALNGPIVDADMKRDVFIKLLSQQSSTRADSLAIGDGANDLKMMNQSTFSVAYHAKPVVRAKSKYAISYGNLDVIRDWLA